MVIATASITPTAVDQLLPPPGSLSGTAPLSSIPCQPEPSLKYVSSETWKNRDHYKNVLRLVKESASIITRAPFVGVLAESVLILIELVEESLMRSGVIYLHFGLFVHPGHTG